MMTYYRDAAANGCSDHFCYEVGDRVFRLAYIAHRGSMCGGRYYHDGFDISKREEITALPDSVEPDVGGYAQAAFAGLRERELIEQ